MFSAAKLHAMYRIANAPIRNFPFPHICVEDVWPPDFYDEIQRHRLGDSAYHRLSETGRVTKGAYDARLCLQGSDLDRASMAEADRNFWAQFFKAFADREFSQFWLDLFGTTVRQYFADALPDIGKKGGVRIYSETLLMRDLPTYSLGPHTDSQSKVVSVLFYLPPDDSHPELGTALYVPKDRRFVCRGGPHHPHELFERVATMPFRPNSVVAFPKTNRSFHGVEPLVDQGLRRDLLLYDLRVDLTASDARQN